MPLLHALAFSAIVLILILYIIWKLCPRLIRDFMSWFHVVIYYYSSEKVWRDLSKPLVKHMNALEHHLQTVPGPVVDVGTGFGIILRYLPAGTSLIAVEPSPKMREYLDKEIPKYPDIKVKKIVDAFGEDMSAIESGSVAAVTCTLLLCGVGSTSDVLKEIKRILKPGGIFIFLEHVHDPEPGLRQRVQNLISAPWGFVFGGCGFHKTWLALEEAGFKDLQYSFLTCRSGVYVMDSVIAGIARV